MSGNDCSDWKKPLSKQVMGQPRAVEQVAEAVRRGLSGVRDESRPVASLLLAGPTGVGKTELCRALAEELFGTKDAMIRLDMSEFMEKQAVSRLIGAPPGYVGYEEGGKLTEAVRRRPYCLVLLDELEKAHPDVAGILLQIMEEGVLTDSTGRRVSFRNAIVVMTSNVGGEIRGDGLGFNPSGRADKTEAALGKVFTPEFLGRLDCITTFRPLTEQTLEAIAAAELQQTAERVRKTGARIQIESSAAKWLAARCTGSAAGARELRRKIRLLVEAPAAELILHATHPICITVQVQDDQLCVRNA